MKGYIKLKASEIPFYRSLAYECFKKYEALEREAKISMRKNNVCEQVSIFKPKTWFMSTDKYYHYMSEVEGYNLRTTLFFNLYRVLTASNDRSMYIDAESFSKLEEENT